MITVKTKQDVFVRVDTEKKARKLKKLLDMMGEKVCPLVFEDIFYDKYVSMGFTFKDEWHSKTEKWEGKTEVTIKELKAILAKEKLKVGDYFIGDLDGYSQEYLVKFERFRKNHIEGCYSYKQEDGSYEELTKNTGYFDNFKRYATKEEIEKFEKSNTIEWTVNLSSDNFKTSTTLEAKVDITFSKKEGNKEIEVGKWYKQNGCFAFNKGLGIETYGINPVYSSESFFHSKNWFRSNNVNLWIEATPQEVEEALIKEAKRRGFDYDDFVFEDLTNILWANYDSDIEGKEEKAIFNNGKWADLIEVDKFAELKEAHKNGAVIQYRYSEKEDWDDTFENRPSWQNHCNYRIKPNYDKQLEEALKTIEKLKEQIQSWVKNS